LVVTVIVPVIVAVHVTANKLRIERGSAVYPGPMRARWIFGLLCVTSCATHVPAPAANKRAVCLPIEVRVVDEANRPVAGARVRTTMTYRQFGPSMLPEASHLETDESAVVPTGADGVATVCKLAEWRNGTVIVEHLDWPTAKRPWHERVVTIGRARAALVQVPVAATCTDPKRVTVAAYAEPLAVDAVIGVERPRHSFTLANLGPWRYWVRSEACGEIVVRALDGRDVPPVLTMDRNEAMIEHAELAGATATVTAFRSSTPLATATLSPEGTAVIELPSNGSYCLRLQKDDRCVATYTRAGEVTRPGIGLDRQAFLARDCPVCAAAP